MNISRMFGSKAIRQAVSICLVGCMVVGTQIGYLSASADGGEVKRIYVSPDSAGGDGSSSSPIGSIEKAMELAKSARDSMASGTVEIVLKSGTYRLDKTLKINKANSGNENVQIAIVGEEGGTAKITNSIQLPNDKFEKVSDQAIKDRIPDAAKNNVYCINLKSIGIQNYGDRGRLPNATTTLVTMNDERFITAKWPNNSEELVGGIGRALLDEIVLQDDAKQLYGFTADVEKEQLEKWIKAEDPTVFGNFEHGYTTAFMDLVDVDTEAKSITMGGQALVFKDHGYWWIENLIDELDQPGEFYMDRENGILYLYPTGDIKTATIEFAGATKDGGGKNDIINVEGGNNFRFENLLIENSLGTSIHCDWTSNDIIIKNCLIRNTYLGIYSQAPGTRIEGCEIYNTSEGGIVAFAGARATLTPGRMVVTNNHIHKTNQGRRLGWILTTEGVDNEFSHNLLHDAPHAAISYGGNGNRIEYNEIYDVIQDTTDAGTIYGGRTWSAYGNVIQYNYIHDIRHWQGLGGSVSIYLDDMISGITVKNNIIQRTAGFMLIGGGHDNTATNNIFLDGLDSTTDALVYDARGYGTHGQSMYTNDPENGIMAQSVKAMPYDSEIWLEKYPQVAASLAEGANPIDPANAVVTGNLAANWSMAPYNQIAKEVRRSGIVENNHFTMKKLTYDYDEKGMLIFTKPEEFDEFEGVEWFDTSKIGLLGGGIYDIPLERQTYLDYGVDLEGEASNVVLVDYPEKVIDAVDLLKNPKNLEMTEDGSVTQSGSNYVVTGQVGYKAEKFDDFVLRYKYKMSEELGSTQVYIRALTPIGDCWTGNFSYNFWLKPDSFETQRWNPASTMIAVTSDRVWRPRGEWNNIEFVFDNLENGSVAIYVNINGHTVSSVQDNNAMKVVNPGYIMFGAPGGSVEIGKYDPSLNTADQSYLDQNKEIQDILDSVTKDEDNANVQKPTEQPIKIVLDGKELKVDTPPYIKYDRTYVPMRAIFEALGAEVEWSEEARGVRAFFGTNRMYMGVNDLYAVLNGEKIVTDSPTEIVNDRTMVGVRFISEMFGCDVDWFADSRIVQIKTAEYAQNEKPTDGTEGTAGEGQEPEEEVKASEKYNDKGNVLLFHKPPQMINYRDSKTIEDGVLDKEADIESLIDFNKIEENYYLREGLLNVKTKLNNQTDRKLNVVFIGGSITQGDGYRNHICDWLSEQFGADRFNFVNAGYGGTGATFGNDRFGMDVTSHDPDLVFIEFAVNDRTRPARDAMRDMEGMVRQALNYNSTTQIVFIYTFCPGLEVEQAAAGKWTNMAKIHDYVAAQYGIPSIFIGADAAKDIYEGKAIGKSEDQNDSNKELPLYSRDGVHATEAGSLRYFDTIKPFLEELFISSTAVLDNMSDGKQTPYLFKDSSGDRVNFALDNYIDGTEITKEAANKYPAAYDTIENVYVSNNPGDGVTFTFTGTQAGILVLSAPDSGMVDVYVDGELSGTYSAWHPIFSNGGETPYAISTPILRNGEHTVSFKVSSKVYDKITELKNISPTQVGAYETIGDEVLQSTKIIFESGWVNGVIK